MVGMAIEVRSPLRGGSSECCRIDHSSPATNNIPIESSARAIWETEYRTAAGDSSCDEAPRSDAAGRRRLRPIRRLVGRLRLKHWALLAALGDTPVLGARRAQHRHQPAGGDQAVADLEQAFGFALFERHARGLRATPLGEDAIAYAASRRRR